jgi:fatty-acyl-CoA synthase
VEKIASALLHMGLRKGDVGGVWSSNLYEYAVAQYALIRIGAISCSLSPVYKSGELEYALQTAKHKVLFLPTKDSRQSSINDFSAVLAGVDREKVPHLQHLVYMETGGSSSALETFSGSFKAHSFDDLLIPSGQSVPTDVEDAVDADDPATIYFTSGTTGKPKGAIVSHFSITNNLRNVMMRKEIVAEDKPIVCLPLPLFHVYAGTVGLFSLSVMPFTLCLVDIRYSAKSVLEVIGKYKCTDLWLVPTQMVDINNHVKQRPGKYDLSSLRNIGAGAAAVPVEVAKECTELYPKLKQMLVGYGATETAAIATYPTKYVPQEKALETVGSPMDFTHVKIVDNSGKMVKHNETGELLVKGYTVMQGYLDDKAKTEECIRNGWYHTGDLATMDAEGVFKIVGRTKEMIIRGGSNIYPREIEELLHEHPQILEAAVCGVPHPKLGEEVCAWIQLVDDKSGLTVQEVKDFCRERISYYKVPAHVIFVTDFPRTLSGKFQKFKMTEQTIELLKLDVKK